MMSRLQVELQASLVAEAAPELPRRDDGWCSSTLWVSACWLELVESRVPLR